MLPANANTNPRKNPPRATAMLKKLRNIPNIDHTFTLLTSVLFAIKPHTIKLAPHSALGSHASTIIPSNNRYAMLNFNIG
jgi:hypothetical protein